MPESAALLRLLLCNENRGFGGAEQYTADLAGQLGMRGHEVTVAARPGSWLAEHWPGFHPVAFASEIDPRTWWSLANVVRQRGIQVIHCQADRDLANAAVVQRCWPAPLALVRTQHTHASSRRSPLLNWAYGRCQDVISVSDAHLEHSRRALPGRHRRIYNALQIPELPLPPAPMLSGRWIGYIGSFWDYKRVDVVIRACAAFLRAEPEGRLLLAGDGPQREMLVQLCCELGLSERTWFPGHVENPYPFFAGLQLFVHAGLRETFSLACLQALACGVPVVAPASGGLPEVVPDGICGLLGDDLAGAVHRYMHDEQLRRGHGETGRERVRRHFGWGAVVREWEDLYSAALSECMR
jgi:glycosyltransferase involved in cell wall biosynthesis